MTTQTNEQLERAHESYRELEQTNKALRTRCGELEGKVADLTMDNKWMKNQHAETEERYQNEIKRLNKIIDSIQGYVGALEVGVK